MAQRKLTFWSFPVNFNVNSVRKKILNFCLFVCFVFFWDRGPLYSSSWPGTHRDSSASASWMLGWKAWVTMPGFNSFLIRTFPTGVTWSNFYFKGRVPWWWPISTITLYGENKKYEQEKTQRPILGQLLSTFNETKDAVLSWSRGRKCRERGLHTHSTHIWKDLTLY